MLPLTTKRSGKVLRLVFYAFLFSASFLVFDRLSFFCLRAAAAGYYASFKTQGASLLARHAIFGKGDGDIVIFGTSRARHALSPSMLSTLLNKRVLKESKASRFPKFFYYYYKEFRKVYSKPKVALYGMDYFMFKERTARYYLACLGLGKNDDLFNPTNTVNEASPVLSRISWLFRMKPEIDDFLSDVMKLKQDSPDEDKEIRVRLRNKNRAHKKKRKGYRDLKAVVARPDHKTQKLFVENKTMVVRPDHWEKFAYKSHPGFEGVYFEKLMVLMEKEKLPVFLLIIPDYIGTNESNFEQDKFKADIQSLADCHKNIFVLDFNRSDRFPLADPRYFSDGIWGKSNCHLSAIGRKEFSRKVARKVRRILNQKKTE